MPGRAAPTAAREPATAGQVSAFNTGAAKSIAVTVNPNSKTTKSSSTPKPMFGLRSAIASRRDATPPIAAKVSPWTHVNISTMSIETGSVSYDPTTVARPKSAVPRTVGV